MDFLDQHFFKWEKHLPAEGKGAQWETFVFLLFDLTLHWQVHLPYCWIHLLYCCLCWYIASLIIEYSFCMPPAQTEKQCLSRNPPGLQYQVETAETSNLVDWEGNLFLVSPVWRQPLLNYSDYTITCIMYKLCETVE